MLVPFETVSVGLTKFFLREIFPKMGGMVGKYIGADPSAMGFVELLAAKRGATIVENMVRPMLMNSQMLRASGLTDDKGSVDVETLCQTAREQMSKTGHLVLEFPEPLGKLTLRANDIDSLHQLCTGGE